MPLVPQRIIVNNTAAPTPTAGPGIYIVTASPVTITLENWSYWPDISQTIKIKDQTGLTSPSITINGATGVTIDGASSVSMTIPNESLTFSPYQNGTSWVIV